MDRWPNVIHSGNSKPGGINLTPNLVFILNLESALSPGLRLSQQRVSSGGPHLALHHASYCVTVLGLARLPGTEAPCGTWPCAGSLTYRATTGWLLLLGAVQPGLWPPLDLQKRKLEKPFSTVAKMGGATALPGS